MPDVLFEALIVAGIACALWRGRLTVRLACATGVLFGMAVDVRQVGEALLLPVLMLMVVCGPGWRHRLASGALASASFAVPVLGYMTAQYTATGHFALTQRGGDMLYARAAAAADCATLRLPADEQPLCPSPQTVAMLGIDGILGDESGPLSIYRPPRGTTTRAMAGRFAAAVVRQQPWAVIGSVDHDFLRLFALTRDGSPAATPITRWQFQLTYPTYQPVITLRYIARVQPGGSPPEVTRPLTEILRAYQLHGGYTPGPLLALALVLGLAGSCGRGRQPGPHQALAGASMICTGAALAILLASDTYEFSWRYQLPALVLLPLAGALGMATLVARFRAERSADASLVTIGPHPRSGGGQSAVNHGNLHADSLERRRDDQGSARLHETKLAVFDRRSRVRAGTSSTSCDQAVFVDQVTDMSPSPDAVLVEVDGCR